MSDAPVQIKFGTDGWRAIIAREFTFVNVERVAQAYADFLSGEAGDGRKPFVVIGFDRRYLSEKFAARTAEVMAGNGFQIALFSEAQASASISAFSVVFSAPYGSFWPRKYAWRTKKLSSL